MSLILGNKSDATRQTLKAGSVEYDYFSIATAEKQGLGRFTKMPASLAVVLENLLRFYDEATVKSEDISAFSEWCEQGGKNPKEIMFRPARVLMQDFTGVPAIVDLAAMRDGLVKLGGDPTRINPINPVDLVIDHSVMIDEFGTPRAFKMNVEREYQRNMERYEFLKWGQAAFDNFRVVPPGTGICHQVNLEYLSKTIWSGQDVKGRNIAYPDTLVGTDSHTTMVNGLAVLGWGVGGIEAEAAMLGQPISLLIPEVIGFKLTGRMVEGTTATDLVLKVVQLLREKGVVGKFVEFYGEGLDHLPLADRATIANMAPEYGATCGYFPIDGETLRYLEQTGRESELLKLVETYAKENGFWRGKDYNPIYTDTLELDMSTVIPAISGPSRPQDHTPLFKASQTFTNVVGNYRGANGSEPEIKSNTVDGASYQLNDGSIVIASITSCTNTSNPYVMIGAGLVARKARSLGLKPKPWVKTSLAPGSKVVSEYLEKAGLQEDLDAMGFNLVGYGCTTCIGNSGPLQSEISQAINEGDLVAVSVLSGNRNFEGRISPDVRANFLASPPLVVAYSLVGDMNVNLAEDPIGVAEDGSQVTLKDIWPTNEEISELVEKTVTKEAFTSKYSDVFSGDEKWRSVQTVDSLTYGWPETSTYVRNPPYFENITMDPPGVKDIIGARCIAVLGDTVTTDHISPAGSFKESTPAGRYLTERQVPPRNFNSYGSRRGNHEVMMRGTFANIRIRNEMLDDVEGGYTLDPQGQQTSIFEAAMKYQSEDIPLVVIAGKQYGTGSSRDWAAKGTSLLGIKAVIAESFERIHRSNLVGMGVIPFEFMNGDNRHNLGFKGDEKITISGLEKGITPLMTNECEIIHADGSKVTIKVKCRIDTEVEVEYLNHGGVLHYVLRDLATK